MFLKKRNIFSKIRRSKVTDYAALNWQIRFFFFLQVYAEKNLFIELSHDNCLLFRQAFCEINILFENRINIVALVMRKPVLEVSDHDIPKPVCLATETS